ncbi:hypothetical protein [Nocardioides sp. Leaf374]|uniref:hypothetical protein n=1 Tax=Nocardioides sp. Leaf374 TaxID=2876560 RepID=UPI001E59D263|nr:hypothetical protein [Nocardioides sp. Leaf374]
MTDPSHQTPHQPDHDARLRERLAHAVDGLRAPDVLPAALARGRRQRTRRRLVQGTGGLAVAAALALAAPALADGWPGGPDPSGPPVAVDPATGPGTGAGEGRGSAPRTPPVETDPAACDPDAAATGWWSRSSEQVRDDLAGLLPAGTRIGGTDDASPGAWGGDLVSSEGSGKRSGEGSGEDADFASVTLLPPPGVPGGRTSLAELSAGGPCSGGDNAPLQAVVPCAELTGHETCEEIRTEDDVLVGVVTEKVERSVVDGREQPTDRSYVLATLADPSGGHVELYVAEGTRADRPDTVHDPADAPALSVEQAREILTDPVWTR